VLRLGAPKSLMLLLLLYSSSTQTAVLRLGAPKSCVASCVYWHCCWHHHRHLL